MTHRIYLDHAATTPLDRRVLDAMLPYLTSLWGNPSGIYAEARAARRALDHARADVAACLGARPSEIVFTASGSEGDNLAIRGVVERSVRGAVPHVVTSAVEHHAVLHTVQALERAGRCRATYLPVDAEGFVSPDDVADSVTPDTALVSVMMANNEVGAIEPVAEIARAARQRNAAVLVHTDAVQAAGVLDLDMAGLGVDLLTVAAHKFYGPRGAAALAVRTGVSLAAQTLGGAQERDRRAGTENVAGIVGMAAALRIAISERAVNLAHATALRDRLLRELPAHIDGVRINGPRGGDRRLPNNVNVSIDGVDRATLLLHLDLNGIAASSGSACTTGSLEPSHVLLAMGTPPEAARNSLRLTVGRDTTDADIDQLLAVLPPFVERMRALNRAGRAIVQG